MSSHVKVTLWFRLLVGPLQTSPGGMVTVHRLPFNGY
jgi:hypothetical protein